MKSTETILGRGLRSAVLAMLGCAVLVACAAPAGGSSSSAPPLTQVELTNDKALLLAEMAFQGGSAALDAAVTAGVLHGEQAAKAKADYDKAKAALDTARAAHDAGQSAIEVAKAGEALSALGELATLAPPVAK